MEEGLSSCVWAHDSSALVIGVRFACAVARTRIWLGNGLTQDSIVSELLLYCFVVGFAVRAMPCARPSFAAHAPDWNVVDCPPSAVSVKVAAAWPPFGSQISVGRCNRAERCLAELGWLSALQCSLPYQILKASYLVDPASSHMLVSKIKPCMSKYKPQ